MVRNFYIKVVSDGRKKPVTSGPAGKEGGFEQEIWVRNQGEPRKIYKLIGKVKPGGWLNLELVDLESGKRQLLWEGMR